MTTNSSKVQRLKELMNSLHMNQGMFAKATGINESNLSKVLNEQRTCGEGIVNKIALAFDGMIDKNWLLTGQGSMMRKDKVDHTRLVDTLKENARKRLSETRSETSGTAGASSVTTYIGEDMVRQIVEDVVMNTERAASCNDTDIRGLQEQIRTLKEINADLKEQNKDLRDQVKQLISTNDKLASDGQHYHDAYNKVMSSYQEYITSIKTDIQSMIDNQTSETEKMLDNNMSVIISKCTTFDPNKKKMA